MVTPFLPGDSLLFAVGAVAAHPESPIRLGSDRLLARRRGGAGRRGQLRDRLPSGPTRLLAGGFWLLNKKHLLRAHDFYEEYGGITIILARFIPIVRTFAPFVAGIGKMSYRRFAVYNVAGGTVWILLFLLAGWWFGGQEFVQKNFKLVIVAIIVISVLPGVYEYIRARQRTQTGAHGIARSAGRSRSRSGLTGRL